MLWEKIISPLPPRRKFLFHFCVRENAYGRKKMRREKENNSGITFCSFTINNSGELLIRRELNSLVFYLGKWRHWKKEKIESMNYCKLADFDAINFLLKDWLFFAFSRMFRSITKVTITKMFVSLTTIVMEDQKEAKKSSIPFFLVRM